MQPHAAMMQGSPYDGTSEENLAHATSSGMRGDRTEWLPAPQHLYSSAAMNHDDASRVLGSRTPSSNSSHGAAAKPRFDLAALSPQVLQEYSKAGYSKEADEKLHMMGAPAARVGWSRNIVEGSGRSGTIITSRGLLNLGAVAILGGALIMMFCAQNIEWYDPGQIITKDGYMEISLTKEANASSHGRGYEVSISLPGDDLVKAAWTMSNLGRAGHGGSLDGYEEVLWQIRPTRRAGSQTCPRPKEIRYLRSVGVLHLVRAVIELTLLSPRNVAADGGHISQSGQWAPFNPSYEFINTSTEYVEYFDTKYATKANSYLDNITDTDNFMSYGFEYKPSFIDGYGTGRITFAQDNLAMWRISDTAMGPNADAGVGERVVTGEPMYILLNLGYAARCNASFGTVELTKLVFPSIMRIDYVRVYQLNDDIRIGCDPDDHPTSDYISKMGEAYTNPNITTLADMGKSFPKNRLKDTC
ncbi:hypothetical protein RQP46_001887 [Phenoliferia psychrophenolica]